MEIEVDAGYRAAEAISAPIAVGTQVVFPGGCRLVGYSADGGAAAGGFAIFDGFDTTGQPVATVNVAANGSPIAWWGPGGIRLKRGATVQVTAALAGLVLYVIPGRRPGQG